ncbi:MAG: zf-TFIIB domain-containing protein [Micropepsaceae bacterium]
MPLLVCPKDNASMQSVQRNGVEFDFCPSCRGVWLDRGELEKLMAASRDEGGYDDAPPRREDPRYAEPRYDERPRERRYDDDDDDYDRRRKKRGFDIFDIFD